MTKEKKIAAFINECFDSLGVNIKEYFFFDFEEGKWEEIPWCYEDGSANTEALKYAAELLGVSFSDILALNDKVITKWWNKYPYFKHIKTYKYAYDRTFYGDGYDEIRMFEAIFNTKYDGGYPARFSKNSIQRRLEEGLRELDKSLPGTYHNGATITDLRIAAANFCEFEDIVEMTESFISMVERAKELFLKVIFSELDEDEIQEYNMLVTVLGLRDKYYTRGYLRYNEILLVKDQYKHLTTENFYDDIVFKHGLDFTPWRCKGFIENRNLVERYLTVMPDAKGFMREFAVAASQFLCDFLWSDAKPYVFSPEEEEEMAYIDELVGQEPIPYDERPKQRTEFYVKKTKEELDGDDVAADLLLGYCRPEKLGGIPVRMPRYTQEASFSRINTLLGKVLHNNFIERCAYLAENSGGGSNE